MSVPYQYVNELFELLTKSAAEADGLAAECTKLRVELDAARRPVKRASFAPDVLAKVAGMLVEEGLVPDGYDASKTAAAIEDNPTRVLDLLFKLAAPVIPEGRPVKAAAPTPLSGEPKTVQLGGNTVVDHDGWLAALA